METKKVKGIGDKNTPIREEMIKRNRWQGRDDRTYLDYVYNVYGSGILGQAAHLTENIIGIQSPERAMKFKKVIKPVIDVARALGGEYTTNPMNNGMETPLGVISNHLYAQSLFWESVFAEERNREGIVGDHKADKPYIYITPSLYSQYGNNEKTVYELGRMLGIDQISGRLVEKLSNGDGFYEDIDSEIPSDMFELRDLSGISGRYKYLWEQVYKSVSKTPRTYFVNIPYASIELENGFVKDKLIYDSDYNFKATHKFPHYDETGKVHKTTVKEYDEYDSLTIDTDDNQYEGFTSYNVEFTEDNSLLGKTNKWFKDKTIKTMSARFYETDYTDGIDTARSYKFGNSHGRNLLKKGAWNDGDAHPYNNGYRNPYCRVWTYHHQYDALKDMIRPFVDGDESPINVQERITFARAKHSNGKLDGNHYLSQNTVLNTNNGLVNIAPSKQGNVDVKKCLFSIENLAWKDVNLAKELSPEQIGPNGGRIMWFPPYALRFQENIGANWSENTFIGRGEKVHTYVDTNRDGTLSFDLLIDHPSIINSIQNTDVTDHDILRFFAGCSLFDPNPNEGKDKDENPIQNQGEPVLSNDDKGIKIKVYCFYPNNYSGNMDYISKKDWMKEGYSDKDWYYYLMLGMNVYLNPGGTEDSSFVGYETSNEVKINDEVTPNLGISVKTDEIQRKDYITSSEKVLAWTDKSKIKEYTADDKDKTRFFYRVDYDLRQNHLCYPDRKVVGRQCGKFDNYQDSASFGLNVSKKILNKYCKSSNEVDKDVEVYTLVEFYMAYSAAKYCLMNDYSFDDILTLEFDELLSVFHDNYYDAFIFWDFKTKVDDIERVRGLAELFMQYGDDLTDIHPQGGATQQDKDNTNVLSQRRCRSLGTLIKGLFKFENEIDCSDIEVVPELKNMNTVNSSEAKAQRFASATLTFGGPKIQNMSDGVDGDGRTIVDDNHVELDKVNEDKSIANGTVVNSVVDRNFNAVRYESESEYFNKLEIKDPMVLKEIKKKYNYFNPAFHSISPEGFNARLTFLQQCTRQGLTISSSDRNRTSTAGNLAFGRPPVCVLRIGDFFYSRILIKSISIDYSMDGGGLSYDLNPEGIGVQPFYAKISMGITIIGGQSLDGPISRLQNAVSFDYYANTGVYDNRADRISGSTYVNIYQPNMTGVSASSNTGLSGKVEKQ